MEEKKVALLLMAKKRQPTDCQNFTGQSTYLLPHRTLSYARPMAGHNVIVIEMANI
jgi:hypothetical protein